MSANKLPTSFQARVSKLGVTYKDLNIEEMAYYPEEVNPLRIIADDETRLYPQEIFPDKEETNCLRLVTLTKTDKGQTSKSFKHCLYQKRKMIILVIVLILYLILNIALTSILCIKSTERVSKETIPDCSIIQEPIKHLQQDKQVNEQLIQQKEEEVQHLKSLQQAQSEEQQLLKQELRHQKSNQTRIIKALNESQKKKIEIEKKLQEMESELQNKDQLINIYKQKENQRKKVDRMQITKSERSAEIYLKLLSNISNGEILDWRILLRIVKRQMQERRNKDNNAKLMVFAAQTELDHSDKSKIQVRYAHITLNEEIMHLHALTDSQPPNNSLILPYEAIQDILPKTSTLTFLDLKWPDHPSGRVYIRLLGDTNRGKQFFWLCTGIKGHSYIGSHFDAVSNKGKAGEYIFGGNYDELKSPPMLPNLSEAGQYLKPSVKGLVTGVVLGDSTQNAKFGLYTRKEPNMNNVLGFGQVDGYKSLSVIKEAAKQSDITSVFIADSGVVIPV